MAAAAAAAADIVIVTDDNPRHEAPDAIRKDVMAEPRML
jgi:UDP-N-acetylmuramyl tripeptide synthase